MPLQYSTNQRMIVMGQTGRGKSEFLKRAIIPYIAKYIIWDIKFEYSKFGRAIHSITELKSAVLTKGCFKIIYQPLPKADLIKEFEAVCIFILEYLRGFTFIVDELQLVAPQNRITPNFKRVITTGRSMGIGVLCATQRPQLIDKTILTQCEHIVIFFVSSKDLEYLSSYFGEGVKWVTTAPFYSWVYCYAGVTENNPPV